MKKYAFFSKIREDTRFPEREMRNIPEYKVIRVSSSRMLSSSFSAARTVLRGLKIRFDGVCPGRCAPVEKFSKKIEKNSRLDPKSPLIKATQQERKNRDLVLLSRGEGSFNNFKNLVGFKNLTGQKGGAMINNMVLSREIEWIGYEHKRNMLQVEFIVGAIYQYENVPEMVYQEFLTAPSHGRFFESNIKNKYQTRKVR